MHSVRLLKAHKCALWTTVLIKNVGTASAQDQVKGQTQQTEPIECSRSVKELRQGSEPIRDKRLRAMESEV
jgi:hypothetical protein